MSKAVFSPTKLFATVAAILLLLPASAQWTNIAPNAGSNMKFVSGTVGYLQNVWTIQKSTNGGVTWTTIDSVSGSFYQQGMFWLNANEGFAVYSENLGFGNYAGWFKKTSNGGATWSAIQQVSASSALYDVWFTSSTTGYAVGENGTICKTINGGSSWTTLTSTTTLDLFTIQFVNATTGYVGGDDGIILKTINSGTSWTNQFQSIYYEFLDIEFTDPLNGCATGTYGLMRTTNGGTNWNPVTVYGTYQFIDLDFPSADTGYMTAPGGNVFRTIDGGASWIGLNRVGTGGFARAVDFISNDTGFVCEDFSGLYKTTNAGSGCPTLTVQNTASMPDTIHACAGTYGVFTATASALNPYVYNVTPAWVWDTAMSYGQYYYVNDSIANDTLQIIITMTDTTTNCGMLTDMMILITDSTTYQPLSQPTWLFNLCPGDSIVLDLGAGAENGYFWQFPMDTTQTITVDTVGMYSGTAYACGNNYNYFFFVQWDTTCAQVCAVDAGPDTTFCQIHGQLNAVPASPGSYQFSWSPAYGLDNPNIQNPTVDIGVDSMMYVVTMTDTANNCTATDTVIVNAYYFHLDTTYNCNGSPVTLDFGPGGTNYIWQFYTDTAGNTTTLNQPGQTITVTQPGQYMGIAFYAQCGALTSVFTVIDSCNVYVGNVWPGDCNYDLVVNMADALHIGLGYGATDAASPNATNGWYAQPMNDWSQNYANCNYKHGDADGNGIIDVNDTVPVALNYSLTHPFRFGQPQVPATAPALTLVCIPDTVGLQTLVQVDVVLGSVPTPIDSLYGISFRITSEAFLIDTSLTAINANNSWLGNTGTDMFTFQKHFLSNAVVDFAEVKNNHINTTNGNGVIATFFIVTTDNLSGIQTCNFDLSDITAVTESQTYILMQPVNDSVVIDPSVPAGVIEAETTPSFTLYPNPANDKVTVLTTTSTHTIEICDMSGRIVKTVVPMSNNTTIETSSLANGMYLVNVKNGSGVTTQKLTISR